jgi:glycosyltransferase involved in cell wall biosynthesis
VSVRALIAIAALIAVAGAGAIVALALASGAAVGAVTLSALLALATLAGLVAVAGAWSRTFRRSANERATRLANAERRLTALVARAEAAERLAEEQGHRIDALSERFESEGALDREQARHAGSLMTSLVSLARHQGVPLTEFLSAEQAEVQVRRAVSDQRILDTLAYLDAYPQVLGGLTLTEARQLLKGLRRLGYLSKAVAVIEEIAARFGNPSDVRAAELYRSELALYRGEIDLSTELPPLEGELERDVVLHLVGKALPETQSGYTLRTQYTVEAQQRLGVQPVVVAQAGAGNEPHDRTETYLHRGTRYYLLGGPQRGSVPWDEWLRTNVEALAEVVRLVRPSVLHTHSDFMNAMIALPVARAYGIPLVNETRGFWEESWLSRTAHAEGWSDVSELTRRYGMPDMYALRVEREAQTRSDSDAVVTLARVMEEHIDRVGRELEMPAPSTSVAPNSVQAENFPVLQPNDDLREALGLPDGGIVVGYISSIVEYEGIDTLVRAMFELEAALDVVRTHEAFPVSIEDAELTDAVGELEPLPEADQPAGEGTALAELRESIAATSVLNAVATAPSEESEQSPAAPQLRDPRIAALNGRLAPLYPELDEAELAVHAMALLDAAEPLADIPVHLMVVGDGAELKNLRSLAADLDLDRVLFTGRVPHDQVLDYYGLIDLFVVPRKRAAVTELVTPLKPFEALSTGRPCVFSDVAALAEIASDSGFVELFRADDHHDLALTIAGLLGDPSRLAEMSRNGAEWVRNERTWDMNALRYLSVYRSLGFGLEAPAAAMEMLALSENGVGASTIVQRLANGPLAEPTGWFLLEPKKYSAAQIIEQGWKLAKLPAIQFEPGMDWEAPGVHNRSWGFHLHAWEFIDPLLQEHARSGDERLLEWMLDVALDWWGAVRDRPFEQTMAWYDMALSLRMPRLARLMIALSKSELSDQTVLLIAPALEHIRRISEDRAFNARNNHGFFAAAAALDFARWLAPLPGSDDLRELGGERMRVMLMNQFGHDGGHLEHSPDYHRMLLASFERALQEGLIEDEETARRIERAAHVLGWLVQPDGSLVQFGDSPRYEVEANGLTSIDPQTTFVLTDGREGSPTREELLVLPETGYAIVRSPQPQVAGSRRQSSYLALQGGFHSRAHKHADDLTFTWFDRGEEILVDAGRFGYIDLLPSDSPDRLKGFYYSAPERQYVESTMAHNTVQVDGEDIERRDREPFGSALGDCVHEAGRFILRAAVRHRRYEHARVLTLEPGRELTVSDEITAIGDVSSSVAWFNMPGDFDLVEREGRVEVTTASGTRMFVESTGQLIEPVRGEQSPLRGWRSLVDREISPTWSFGFSSPIEQVASITTRFVFESPADAEAGATAIEGARA